MKNIKFAAVLLSFCLFFLTTAFSQQYKITGINYTTDGPTKLYALENNIPIDQNRIFSSEEELTAYLEQLKVLFNNERNFKSAQIEYSIDNIIEETDLEDSVSPVTLNINIEESSHVLFLAAPKYDSSAGLTVKAKLSDTNFLGTLNTLSADFYYNGTTKEADSAEKIHTLGLDFDYNFPFNIWKIKGLWINDYTATYEINSPAPEFNALTGISLLLPFNDWGIKLTVLQKAVYDKDYCSTQYAPYFGNVVKLALPQIIKRDGRTVEVAPYIKYVQNYDKNGISSNNTELQGPLLFGGFSYDEDLLSWNGNFRDGYSIHFIMEYGYNFYTREIVCNATSEVIYCKPLGFGAINFRLISIIDSNNTHETGQHIRGVINNQKYALEPTDEKCLAVESALITNLDFPFHIITWEWQKYTDIAFLTKFNFELQGSVFLDAALVSNKVTGTICSLKDGFYAGGFEVLVYPEHWRSMVVRASLGFDLGKIAAKNFNFTLIDTSWRRDTVKPYELYIGLGLLY